MIDLFEAAEAEHLEVIYMDLPECGSMSMHGNIGMDYGLLWGGAEERVHLAHEIGHCVTGSFYNRYSPCDVRAKHEHCADKWAIKKLVQKDELQKALKAGYTEPWDLAERFDVTVPFMLKAMAYYQSLSRK